MQGTFGDRRVSVEAEQAPIRTILERFAEQTGLEYDIRQGVVVFSTPERLYAVYGEEEIGLDQQSHSGKVRKLLEQKWNFDYYRFSPKEILEHIAESRGFRVRFDGSARMLKAGRILARFENVRIRDIIAFLTKSTGDDAVWVPGDGLWIGPPERIRGRAR